MPQQYRGRFAPSPTGPLHFGSLVAAMASYLEAKTHDGHWLLRIDDVDQTRARPGLDLIILKSLENFGFSWDGPVTYQSSRTSQYQKVIKQLGAQNQAYPCSCSRRIIATNSKIGREGPIYPGTCRNLSRQINEATALRLQTDDRPISFEDTIAGPVVQHIESEIGDFIIRRVDGYTAYQLAVVVDDHDQQITHVVRGADLLWSTPRQILLQKMLGYSTPDYTHIPLILGADGKKLSKRDNAHPVDEKQPVKTLLKAWNYLAQTSFKETPAEPGSFWTHAINNWQINKLTPQR